MAVNIEPVGSLGELIQQARTAKVKSPTDPAVDAALRQIADASGNPFWRDVVDEIIREFAAGAPGSNPELPSGPPNWLRRVGESILEWVWGYLKGRFGAILATAVALGGVWMSGVANRPRTPADTINRTDAVGELDATEKEIQEQLFNANGTPKTTATTDRIKQIFDAHRGKLKP